MPLTGDAKKEYQREYMRRRRQLDPEKTTGRQLDHQTRGITFLSKHPAITYRIPGSPARYARFEGGCYTTSDALVQAYLQQHSDYGFSLFTATKSVVVP